MAPRLETKHLMRRYEGRVVVDDVSLEVQPGQVTCLLGPSGCGKSTTLRMIAGVEMQDEGEIWVDGNLVCDTVFRIPPERRNIGLMFQDFALFPHLRVGENVAFGLSGDKSEKDKRVGELLERVGLEGYAAKFPHELSGGEQQRVALARALAPRPRIMLMDEPFSGLDNRLRDGIRDETLEVLREADTAVLLVTHEPEEAMRMADNIALMRHGRIVQQGAPYNIFNAPADRDAVAFFSDVNVVRAEVSGALAQTPFGQFLAPGIADGQSVDIVVRPQHVKIDFDRNGGGWAHTI
ncbi:MAG: ABC transporter ATP-binding protein, partial [Pseudomonadota bacterium]